MLEVGFEGEKQSKSKAAEERQRAADRDSQLPEHVHQM
jgi:hypothetical protein